jgi:hypothetical protein
MVLVNEWIKSETVWNGKTIIPWWERKYLSIYFFNISICWIEFWTLQNQGNGDNLICRIEFWTLQNQGNSDNEGGT